MPSRVRRAIADPETNVLVAVEGNALLGFGIMIYREDMYEATEENQGVAELIMAKQRNGPTGDVNLTFLKSYTRFESAAKVSAEDVPN